MRDCREVTEKQSRETIYIRLQGHVREDDTREYHPERLREVGKR